MRKKRISVKKGKWLKGKWLIANNFLHFEVVVIVNVVLILLRMEPGIVVGPSCQHGAGKEPASFASGSIVRWSLFILAVSVFNVTASLAPHCTSHACEDECCTCDAE